MKEWTYLLHKIFIKTFCIKSDGSNIFTSTNPSYSVFWEVTVDLNEFVYIVATDGVHRLTRDGM